MVNVIDLYTKHLLFLPGFNKNLNFMTDFQKNSEISNAIKILLVSAEFSRADGWTNVTKLIVPF
jgi:hypothetical protein